MRARGGDHALTVKGDWGPLHTHAQTLIAEPDPGACATTTGTSHGRTEQRQARVRSVPAGRAAQL